MLELFKDFLSGSVTEKHYKAMLYSFIIFYKAILLLEIIHLLSASLQMLTVRSLWLGWCWRYLLIFSGSVSCLPSPDSVVSQHIFSSLTPLPFIFFCDSFKKSLLLTLPLFFNTSYLFSLILITNRSCLCFQNIRNDLFFNAGEFYSGIYDEELQEILLANKRRIFF